MCDHNLVQNTSKKLLGLTFSSNPGKNMFKVSSSDCVDQGMQKTRLYFITLVPFNRVTHNLRFNDLSVFFKTGGRVTGSFLTALPTVMVARLPALGPGDQCVPSTAPHR